MHIALLRLKSPIYAGKLMTHMLFLKCCCMKWCGPSTSFHRLVTWKHSSIFEQRCQLWSVKMFLSSDLQSNLKAQNKLSSTAEIPQNRIQRHFSRNFHRPNVTCGVPAGPHSVINARRYYNEIKDGENRSLSLLVSCIIVLSNWSTNNMRRQTLVLTV